MNNTIAIIAIATQTAMFLAVVIGAYWQLKLDMSKRFAEQEAKINERLKKDVFQASIDGIRSDVQTGLAAVTESYHDLDKKDAEHELRLKMLESNHGQ